MWGHTHEFDMNDNWDRIEKFAEKMGNRDNIWYATNMEIYQYTEAYRSLQFSADGSLVYNPTAITVWFLSGATNVKVNPGETVKIR